MTKLSSDKIPCKMETPSGSPSALGSQAAKALASGTSPNPRPGAFLSGRLGSAVHFSLYKHVLNLVSALRGTSQLIPRTAALVHLSSICRGKGEGTKSKSHLAQGHSAHHWPYMASATRAQDTELGLQAVTCPDSSDNWLLYDLHDCWLSSCAS
jgi:hypothetical protein